MTQNLTTRLSIALVTLRVGIFIVMFMWTLDKFVTPEHAAKVFEGFYGLSGLGAEIMIGIGIAEMILVVAFLLGLAKRLTYGLVFLLHAISTLSSYAQYLEPFDHLLFFAAWPMLAACFALYYLRDQDTLLTWKTSR